MVTFSGLRKVLIVVVCSQALTVFSQPFVQRPEQFKAHVNRIVDERHPFSEQLKQISRLYEQMYGDEKLVLIGRANDEVAGIFDATHETFFYTHKPEYLSLLERVFSHLQRNGAAEYKHYEALYGSYVIGRKFSEAKALASTFGQKFGDSLPESIDASTRLDSGLTVWHIDIDRPMLVSKNFIWPRGVQVVVLVNPACRFSRNFFDSLRNDKSLRKIFKNAVYLIPPHSGLQFDLVREWNRANTEFQMVLAEARRDWPDVQHWETPVFYLYSNGKLVEYIIGWPEAGNRHAIYRAFKRASAQLTGDLSLNGF